MGNRQQPYALRRTLYALRILWNVPTIPPGRPTLYAIYPVECISYSTGTLTPTPFHDTPYSYLSNSIFLLALNTSISLGAGTSPSLASTLTPL